MSKIDEKSANEAWRRGNPSIDELPFPAFLAMLENYEAAKVAEQPDDCMKAFEKFKQAKIPAAGAVIHAIAEEAYKDAWNAHSIRESQQPVVQLDFVLADLPEVLKEPWDKIRPYVNGTPELLSLLYDLDLMPEQIIRKRDFVRMMQLAEWHKHSTPKRESGLPTEVFQELMNAYNAAHREGRYFSQRAEEIVIANGGMIVTSRNRDGTDGEAT